MAAMNGTQAASRSPSSPTTSSITERNRLSVGALPPNCTSSTLLTTACMRGRSAGSWRPTSRTWSPLVRWDSTVTMLAPSSLRSSAA